MLPSMLPGSRVTAPFAFASRRSIAGGFVIVVVLLAAALLLSDPHQATVQGTPTSNVRRETMSRITLDDIPQSIVDFCELRYDTYNLPRTSTYRPGVSGFAADAKKCLAKSTVLECGAHALKEEFDQLNVDERELLSWESETPVFYAKEAAALIQGEKEAVMRAMPSGMNASDLNGVDIGAGGDITDRNFIGIEPHRSVAGLSLPSVQQPTYTSVLSWGDNLPFMDGSLDMIVSRHNLEHLDNPVEAVLHMLQKIKPGGGLGVVVPNAYFTWAPSNDNHPWGHRWNTDPVTICKLYHKYWADVAILEHLATLEYRMSFDFVLRKKGEYRPFQSGEPNYKTGKQKSCNGDVLTQAISLLGNKLAKKHGLNISKTTHPSGPC